MNIEAIAQAYDVSTEMVEQVAKALGHAGINTPLDVREFGAVADGVTDDTAAFQRAVDWCALEVGGDAKIYAIDTDTRVMVQKGIGVKTFGSFMLIGFDEPKPCTPKTGKDIDTPEFRRLLSDVCWFSQIGGTEMDKADAAFFAYIRAWAAGVSIKVMGPNMLIEHVGAPDITIGQRVKAADGTDFKIEPQPVQWKKGEDGKWHPSDPCIKKVQTLPRHALVGIVIQSGHTKCVCIKSSTETTPPEWDHLTPIDIELYEETRSSDHPQSTSHVFQRALDEILKLRGYRD